jgi:hypothetical protein
MVGSKSELPHARVDVCGVMILREVMDEKNVGVNRDAISAEQLDQHTCGTIAVRTQRNSVIFKYNDL